MKKLFNLKNLIFFTVFCLPLYLIRIKVGGISVNVLDLMILLCLLVWIIAEKEKAKHFLSIFQKNKKIFFAIFLIFLGFLGGLLKTDDVIKSLGIIKSWLVLPFLFGLIGFQVLKEKKDRKKLFDAYFLSAFFVSFLSIIYFFLGYLTYDFRLEGIFNSPNYLAMYLAPAFIYGSYNILSIKNKSSFFLYLLLSFPIIISIYLTKSYTGWLALILCLFVLVYFFRKDISRKILILILIIFLCLVLCQSLSKIQTIFSLGERSSLFSRGMIWKSSGMILKENWVLGIGSGNFQDKYLDYQKYFPPYLEWAVPHPHNIYLNFWMSGGILASLGFLVLIFYLFKTFLEQKNKKASLGAFLVLLYFLLHGFFDTTYFKNDLATIFWVFYFPFLKQN